MSFTPARMIAAAGAALALAVIPSAANAAAINVSYDATGTSYVAKTTSSIAVGPTTLSVGLDTDSTFTGHLAIPSARTTFKALGLLPTTATVSFIEAAPVTGKLNNDNGRLFITSTASYYLKLTDIRVLGLPTLQGTKCQTKAPVTIPANSPDGDTFNVLKGGKLTGTFAIGEFVSCGLDTLLINTLVSGPDNTVDLDVTNGHIG